MAINVKDATGGTQTVQTLPAAGQTTMATSLPVVIASNQTPVPVYPLFGTPWKFAAASGGILNTTVAVTLVAAAGAGLSNYLLSLQINAEVLGTATEVAIRDGAGGTVLWRTKIGTGGQALANIIPAMPIKGTANTLLEVVTLTASGTGAVYVNAQGSQAA